MNVDSFKSAFNDLARPNRFEVILARGGPLQFFCKATDVPGNTVDPMDVPYQGRVVKLPGDRTNPDWTMTVYGKDTYDNYNAFSQWLETINGVRTNVSATPSSVKEDGIIRQLGRNGSVLRSWKIIGCFPTELGNISLDWSNNSSPMEFTVTLANDGVEQA